MVFIDLCYHCTDFFRKTKIRSRFLRFLGAGVLMGVKMGFGGGEPKANHPSNPIETPIWTPNPRKRRNRDRIFGLRKSCTMLTQIFLYRELISVKFSHRASFWVQLISTFLNKFCPLCIHWRLNFNWRTR